MCSQIAESDCRPVGDFAGGQEYDAGCTWETQYRDIEWMSVAACEAQAEENPLDPDGTPCAYHEDCQSGCCGADGCGPCGG